MFGPDGAKFPKHHMRYQYLALMGPDSPIIVRATNVWPRWGQITGK